MDHQKPPVDYPGILIITTLLLLLSYAGYLAYQSIDWDALKHLEAQPLMVPPPTVVSPTSIPKK